MTIEAIERQVCDRCKKVNEVTLDVTEDPQHYPQRYYRIAPKSVTGVGHADLCNDCVNAFQEWLDEHPV